MRTKYLFVTIVVLAFGPAAESTQPVGWRKYVVPETGANVAIPDEIFTQDAGPPDRGYGRRFQTGDGRANLTVNSMANVDKDTPASFLRKHFALPRSAAVYRRITGRFFVVSGIQNERIWYNRCNFAREFIHCVLLNYPANEKRQWDDVVTQISQTLASHS